MLLTASALRRSRVSIANADQSQITVQSPRHRLCRHLGAPTRTPLFLLRGWVTSSFATQAAEWHLRHQLDLVGIDDVRLVRDHMRDGGVEAWFRVADGALWRVRLRIGRTPPEQLTCQSPGLSLAPTYELVDVTPVDNAGTDCA